jgi:hypothetical protein
MNVYFGWEIEARKSSWLQKFVANTGGGEIPPGWTDDILRSLAISAGVGTTFRWDSPEMGRWCVYGLDISGQKIDLPPRLRAFRDHAPANNCDPQYNAAWSLGPAGSYMKMEKSYARDATYFLTAEMGGDLTHLPATLAP